MHSADRDIQNQRNQSGKLFTECSSTECLRGLNCAKGKWQTAMCSIFLFVTNNGRQCDFTGGCGSVQTTRTTFRARRRKEEEMFNLKLFSFQLRSEMWVIWLKSNTQAKCGNSCHFPRSSLIICVKIGSWAFNVYEFFFPFPGNRQEHPICPFQGNLLVNYYAHTALRKVVFLWV